MESFLRGVNVSDGFDERLLLEFILNRQAQFSELFDVGAGVKFQFFEVRKHSQRLLQFRRVWFLFRFRSWSSFNGGALFSGRSFSLEPLCLLPWLMRTSTVALMMLG